MSEWSKEHAWKVCILQKGIEGSNPSLSAVKPGSSNPGFFLLYGQPSIQWSKGYGWSEGLLWRKCVYQKGVEDLNE